MIKIEQTVYDVVVVGGGPAGLSATLYASRMELKTLLLSKEMPGGQLWNTETIDNYLGFGSVSASDLATSMYKHATAFGAELKIGDDGEVIKIKMPFRHENGTHYFKVVTSNNLDGYNAKSLIVATGTSHHKLFNGDEDGVSGISYCAVCDAPFYKGTDVAVVGGGDSALEATLLLSDIAERVFLIHRRDEFRGNPNTLSKVEEKENVIIIKDSIVKSFTKVGDSLDKIQVESVNGNSKFELEVSGLFPNIGGYKNDDVIKDCVFEYYDGLFFAGDITSNDNQQVAIAVGDGANMALNAYKYLAQS